MQIDKLEVEQHKNYTCISAQIGPYPLWFRTSPEPDISSEDASPFLISALIPSMLLAEDITVDKNYFISEKLYKNIEEIQTILNHWNPIFRIIKVKARTSAVKPKNGGCGSFFSAGVDSVYTAIKHNDEIDTLVLINGFDFNMDTETWKGMVDRNRKLAAVLNKKLFLVETNLKEFTGWFNLARYVNFGASLATIANLLSLSKLHISSHGTFDLIRPSGVHPILDPLWSTEACTLVHTGLEADRTKKLRLIKSKSDVLPLIWVCWKDPKINCGKCSKCVRSFIALTIVEIETFSFQSPVNLKQVGSLSILNDEQLDFFEYFQKEAESSGLLKLERLLNKIIFKYRVRAFLKVLDQYLFNSALTDFRRGNIESDLAAISASPRYTDKRMLNLMLESHTRNEMFTSIEHIGTAFE